MAKLSDPSATMSKRVMMSACVVGVEASSKVSTVTWGLRWAMVSRALDLRRADRLRRVHDLALQIVQRNPIVVDDADGADAGRREVEKYRAAEAAGPGQARARP